MNEITDWERPKSNSKEYNPDPEKIDFQRSKSDKVVLDSK